MTRASGVAGESEGASVAVIGPGAIGSAAAAAIQRAGRHRLVVCGRRDHGRIRVDDDTAGSSVTVDAPFLTSASQVTAPVDWVLLAVKAHQTEGAGTFLSALCGPGTRVAVLQNGVEHRQRVEPLVVASGAEVLPVIVWISAEQTEPGVVRVRGEVTPRLQVPAGTLGQEFGDLLRGGPIAVEPVEDFTTAVWMKLTTNAIGGLMAATGRRASVFQRDDVDALARELARECLAVARAEGASFGEGVADTLVDHFVKMPPDTGSSILFDRLAGRALEWDARNGVIRRLGRAHGIRTPVSDVLVPLLAAASDG